MAYLVVLEKGKEFKFFMDKDCDNKYGYHIPDDALAFLD